VVEVMCERGMGGMYTLNFALLHNILGLLRVKSQKLSCGIYRGDRGRGEGSRLGSAKRPTKRRSIESIYPQKQLCRASKAPRRCRIGYAG